MTLVLLLVASAFGLAGCSKESNPVQDPRVDLGRETFRHDTFGDEAFWTDTLRMHEVIPTISPVTALAIGLKVDAEALPPGTLESADLNDPSTTVALLSLDAVVGVKAEVTDGKLVRMGITCALCHSTVDNSAAPGIGQRLDGFANRDLDPGHIISLSPVRGQGIFVDGSAATLDDVVSHYDTHLVLGLTQAEKERPQAPAISPSSARSSPALRAASARRLTRSRPTVTTASTWPPRR